LYGIVESPHIGVVEYSNTGMNHSVDSVECRPISANMISIQHTVGITESTDQTFTNLSDKDYALEGGLVASIQCGKKSTQPIMKPETTLNKFLLPLNIDSSTDCLEYSKAMNFMNTYKKRPFGKEVNEKAFFKLIIQYIHQKKRKGTFKVDET
jgi:hypothetical protein